MTITISPINDAPSFTLAGDPPLTVGGNLQTIEGFAFDIMAGPANESSQAVRFSVELVRSTGVISFIEQPFIHPITGTLTYQVAEGSQGVAEFVVVLIDNGRSISPHVNASRPAIFIVIADVPGALQMMSGTASPDDSSFEIDIAVAWTLDLANQSEDSDNSVSIPSVTVDDLDQYFSYAAA